MNITNIKKQYQQTTGLINQQHTSFVDWCYCGREVLFEKVYLIVVHKFVLGGAQFLAKHKREKKQNIDKFGRSTV